MDSWSNRHLDLHYSRYDCWQLCVRVYDRELGIELPSFRGQYPSKAEREVWSRMISEQSSSSDWVEISSLKEAKAFDLLLFWVVDPLLPTHLGIWVDRIHMLTTTRSTGSRHEAIGKWQRKLVGIYRHVEKS